ncbi:MAG: TATA-box-binding protein [Candidatus Lokiarchaeota archaeon]|nr:TATA-box-binding protein [Candidatus Lokiarchaeota archaeon]
MGKKRTASALPARGQEVEPEWKVENVVATVTVGIEEGKHIDLNQIARKHPDCEYNPERFPGLVMRVASPRASILVFSSGKMVVTGLRDASDAGKVANMVVARIKGAKVDVVGEPTVTIRNVVASGNLHTSIDLNEASVIMDNAVYEPEVFPGMIYRMAEPKAVFLIFSTGRIVCTGAKTKEGVGEAVAKLDTYIKELGLSGTRFGANEGGYLDD